MKYKTLKKGLAVLASGVALYLSLGANKTYADSRKEMFKECMRKKASQRELSKSTFPLTKTPQELANRVLEYAKFKSGIAQKTKNGFEYNINRFPSAILGKGYPMGNSFIIADRIKYEDTNPKGPSEGDKLEIKIGKTNLDASVSSNVPIRTWTDHFEKNGKVDGQLSGNFMSTYKESGKVLGWHKIHKANRVFMGLALFMELENERCREAVRLVTKETDKKGLRSKKVRRIRAKRRKK